MVGLAHVKGLRHPVPHRLSWGPKDWKLPCGCFETQKKQFILKEGGELTSPDPTPPSAAAAAKSLQSCPTLCNPIDGSPPGSPVPGILQARILEWVAISFSAPPSNSLQTCTPFSSFACQLHSYAHVTTWVVPGSLAPIWSC